MQGRGCEGRNWVRLNSTHWIFCFAVSAHAHTPKNTPSSPGPQSNLTLAVTPHGMSRQACNFVFYFQAVQTYWHLPDNISLQLLPMQFLRLMPKGLCFMILLCKYFCYMCSKSSGFLTSRTKRMLGKHKCGIINLFNSLVFSQQK